MKFTIQLILLVVLSQTAHASYVNQLKPFRNYFAVTEKPTAPKHWLHIVSKKKDAHINCSFQLDSLDSEGIKKLTEVRCSGGPTVVYFNELKEKVKISAEATQELYSRVDQILSKLKGDYEERDSKHFKESLKANALRLETYGYGQRMVINEIVPVLPKKDETTNVSATSLNGIYHITYDPHRRMITNFKALATSQASMCVILGMNLDPRNDPNQERDFDCKNEPQWIDFVPPKALRGYVMAATFADDNLTSKKLTAAEHKTLMTLVNGALQQKKPRLSELAVTKADTYLPSNYRQLVNLSLKSILWPENEDENNSRQSDYTQLVLDPIKALDTPQDILRTIKTIDARAKVSIDLSRKELALTVTLKDGTTETKVSPLVYHDVVGVDGVKFVRDLNFDKKVFEDSALYPSIRFENIRHAQYKSLSIEVDARSFSFSTALIPR